MVLSDNGTRVPQKARTPSLLLDSRTHKLPKRRWLRSTGNASVPEPSCSKSSRGPSEKIHSVVQKLQQVCSQLSLSLQSSLLAVIYKSSHGKKHNRKGEKAYGAEHTAGANISPKALIQQKLLVDTNSGFAHLPAGGMGDFSLSVPYLASWASAGRALCFLQLSAGPSSPKRHSAHSIHNLGTIRNTNWPLRPF